MTLRINHNIAAINAHRNLVRNDAKLGKTLEHLSSGMKVNRASDGPATLVISEQMRAQVAGLKQAVMNSETAVALVQTTEASLTEMNRLLISMRQLAVHASNEGVNDSGMLEADQAELVNALDSIDRIADSAQFGTKKLLDGSLGINGIASGEDLTFMGATTKTKDAPQSGYAIDITQEATQAQVTSRVAMSRELIDAGEVINLMDGSKSIKYQTRAGTSLEEIRNELNSLMTKEGLKLDVYFDEMDRMVVNHQEYGSEKSFTVISSTSGFLSDRAATPLTIQNGYDVQGTIGSEFAVGKGQILTGGVGTNVEGLQVRYTGIADPMFPEVGRVAMKSNALTFQVGGNHNQITQILIPGTSSRKLAQDVNNESGYKSIRGLDVRDFQGAQDALLLIDKAIDQITGIRGDLGAVQKNTLEANIASLSIAKENLINSESVLRDTDMAAEMSEFTKYQIMSQAATAMLAQANQTPNNVLSLLQ
ncbi:flagellin [bacterium]|nr:flagellin [bacterium]